jgi:hypothetical protein
MFSRMNVMAEVIVKTSLRIGKVAESPSGVIWIHERVGKMEKRVVRSQKMRREEEGFGILWCSNQCSINAPFYFFFGWLVGWLKD